MNRTPRVIILGGIALATAVLLVLTATGLFEIPFLDTVIRVVFVPVQRFATETVQNTQEYFTNMAYERNLEEHYQVLNEENKELRAMLLEMEELRRENERLSALHGRTEGVAEGERLLGKVVAMSPGNWFSSFTIDVGENHGVEVDDPVVNADGLVGRISTVYDSYATVITIVDGRSSVAGLIERTRDDGIIRGNLYLNEQDEACHMFYLPAEAEYQPGDRVLTSGLDGIYPKGLLIGQVKGVSHDMSAERYAVISPSVNFRHVEEVFVLLDAREKLPEELMP
jgi:rod shape-determining protein MreC